MKEMQVTTNVVKALCSVNECFAKKRHSGKFQSGDPDIAACYLGAAIYIEMKVLSGELTSLQASQLEKWRNAGALTFMGIYDPSTKFVKFIAPDGGEMWEQFAGPGIVKTAYFETHAPANTVQKFDFEGWLGGFCER